MKDKLNPVKQHIRLLDKPIWTPSRKISDGKLYSDKNGFEMSTTGNRGLPTVGDRLLLASLLRESQNREDAVLKYHSMYHLTKALDLPYGGDNIVILENSLAKWAYIRLHFTAPFYYDAKYKRKAFSIFAVFNSVRFSTDSGIRLEFNQHFLEINKDKYTRLLNVEKLRHIGTHISPFALRLYEILIINLHNRTDWAIGVENFCYKMAIPYEPRNRSKFAEQLEQAVQELSKVESTFKMLIHVISKNKHGEPMIRFQLANLKELSSNFEL